MNSISQIFYDDEKWVILEHSYTTHRVMKSRAKMDQVKMKLVTTTKWILLYY